MRQRALALLALAATIGILLSMGCGPPAYLARVRMHPEDPEIAPGEAKAFRRDCDGGDMAACVALGIALEAGIEGSRNRAAAKALYERGCEKGDGPSCYQLARLLWNGKGVPRDFNRAADLYEQACKTGDLLGCCGLGRAYINGQGRKEDKARGA